MEVDTEIRVDDINDLYDKLKSTNKILEDVSKEQFVLLFNVWRYNHLSLRSYEHKQKYTGDIVIFEAKEEESENLLTMMNMIRVSKGEWIDYIDGKITKILIPGNHYTLLSSPNVQTLAKEFAAYML